MIRFEEILDRVAKHHPGDNLDLVRRAYIFSAKELMILQGWGWVISKEPMVAFIEPRQSAGG